MLKLLAVGIGRGLLRGVVIGIIRAVNESGKPAKPRNRFPGKRPGKDARVVDIIRGDGSGRCGK